MVWYLVLCTSHLKTLPPHPKGTLACSAEYQGAGTSLSILPQCPGTSLAFTLTLSECPRHAQGGVGVQMTGALGTFDCCVCCLDSAGTNDMKICLKVKFLGKVLNEGNGKQLRMQIFDRLGETVNLHVSTNIYCYCNANAPTLI